MFRGAWLSLVVGAAIAAIAAGGARAAVRPIGWDGCSGGCGSSAMSIADSAQDGADAKITMSLIGGGPAPGALLFDREAAPTVLASGFESGLSPDGGEDSGAGVDSTYDFEYVFTHPDKIGGPASFLSVASLTGQLTLGEFLSESNAYFVAQSEAFSRALIEPDLGTFPRIVPPRYAGFSTDDGEPVRKDATRPKFPWMQWVDSSAGSSPPPSQ